MIGIFCNLGHRHYHRCQRPANYLQTSIRHTLHLVLLIIWMVVLFQWGTIRCQTAIIIRRWSNMKLEDFSRVICNTSTICALNCLPAIRRQRFSTHHLIFSIRRTQILWPRVLIMSDYRWTVSSSILPIWRECSDCFSLYIYIDIIWSTLIYKRKAILSRAIYFQRFRF